MQINLISDTVTRPTAGMLDAMMEAKVGDDVFKNDPSVNALEEKVANYFGMEAALFFPSGTMTNQTAIKLHTQPGDQLICDKYAHVYNYEGGGVSFNSGVSCKLVDGHRGMMTADQVLAAINPPDFYHSPKTSLVCIENTTNKGGGACWDFDELQKIREVCKDHGLKYHLDGARLWNALVAKKHDAKAYGKLFDSISVCFSKGLGCPVGSVLVGDTKMIEDALRIRKILGGGMRQSGYLAAAATYALDHNLDRLEEDHQKAKEIGELLNNLEFIKKVEPIETNIIIFELDESKMSATDFLAKLEEKQISIIGMGQGKLRIVTHLDYTDVMHQHFLCILKEIG
ncbi:aminotransferase class I/II-fold pyridoxal phosphate-dependent enzyme [Muricauda sp. JGD-17]|uniref:Aminotransferase class I/II-fold pyridoxal phosphate-dependent enzyme n=1 Tax=Flagellimonas ochracea TaxID=2696472 RepID=A0A964WWU0_9FLAO|nr:GntG family PLP-dependent aldolase [Allomuricauda ochracea]NAY91118.1 aminotransferase class I/II-fold pyridoxal phosphate-dependent enzyme [Allomuricauda ochracea]